MLKQEALPARGISSMEDLVIRPCAYCEGIGEVDIGEFVPVYEICPTCKGYGNIRVPSYYIGCHKCDGTGQEDTGELIQWFLPCEKCHGTGWTAPPPAYR